MLSAKEAISLWLLGARKVNLHFLILGGFEDLDLMLLIRNVDLEFIPLPFVQNSLSSRSCLMFDIE
jgi:hypothetical protein